MDWSRIAGAFVPSLCAVCRAQCDPGALVCPACLWDLDVSGPVFGEPPPGISEVVSVSPHEGVGRDLLMAYKFRGSLGLGKLMARRMAEVAPIGPWDPDDRAVVAVPAARLRKRMRGFDTAGDLARRLAAEIDWTPGVSVISRVGIGRQRGRGRTGRMGNPPKILGEGSCPTKILLVDDVMTTGATLAACAKALRGCGARRISAITFTNRV